MVSIKNGLHIIKVHSITSIVEQKKSNTSLKTETENYKKNICLNVNAIEGN